MGLGKRFCGVRQGVEARQGKRTLEFDMDGEVTVKVIFHPHNEAHYLVGGRVILWRIGQGKMDKAAQENLRGLA